MFLKVHVEIPLVMWKPNDPNVFVVFSWVKVKDNRLFQVRLGNHCSKQNYGSWGLV